MPLFSVGEEIGVRPAFTIIFRFHYTNIPGMTDQVDAVTYCEQTCMPKREILNESPFLSIIIRNEYFPCPNLLPPALDDLWPSILFTPSPPKSKETIKRPVGVTIMEGV